MKTMMRWLGRALAVLIVLAVAGYATFRWKNPPPQLAEPNYYTYYQQQDRVPAGKVAVLVTQLLMPEDYRGTDYYNLALKPLQYMPWPVRNFATADRGVVLLDDRRYYEFEKFEPTRLRDLQGRDSDLDGESYMDKYRAGEVQWVPPSPRIHSDHGYFLLKTHPAGVPTISAKLMTKARIFYHEHGIAGGKLPHEAGMRAIAAGSLARVEEKYGPVPWRITTADHFGLLEQAVRELLDGGAQTLVVAPMSPIYSHHEEFNGAFRHTMHYVHEWEHEHGRQIKVIFTPQLGDFPVVRQAFLQMLKDRLDSLPKGKDVSVKAVVSVHGMKWDAVPHEAWLALAPAYRDAMVKDVQAMLAGYDFGRRQVVLAQDHFADPISDPTGKWLSTNKAFRDGVRDGYTYAINLPIEFFAENSDTLFSHAMFNFEGLPGYDRYETIDYRDWSVPYTREFQVKGTRIIYNGVPVGHYNVPIVEAHFEAIDSILGAGVTPIR